MRLETKAQIARTSLSLLVAVVFVFLLGLVVLVLCAGLQINPFRETTTSFLISAFFGLIGVAAVLVLLSVATNISIIADAKIRELQLEERPQLVRKWTLVFVSSAILIVAVVLVGTHFSKERYLRVVRRQANEVLSENRQSVEELGRLFASDKPEDMKHAGEIRNFLASRRQELPQLTLIYFHSYEGKPAFYQVSQNYDPPSLEYKDVYYACSEKVDCDYLNRFFRGENVAPLQKYTLREDRFYIEIPVITGAARYVLLFESWNSYGKIGS